MFLTRCFLNPARRDTGRLLGSPQRMHAAVLAGFPPGSDSEESGGRVLWRVDEYPRRRVELLVVSPQPPDLTHLVEQAGWPAGGEGWQTTSYERFLSSLQKGQSWAFRLVANPVKHGRRPGDKKSRPFALVREEDQIRWLWKRQADLGVSLGDESQPSISVLRQNRRRFDRRSDDKAGRVVVHTVTFQGHLQVDDPVRLRQTLTHGVGRARGYGCGLLTLAQPS